MIKTQTKFEKSKAMYYQAYSKNPPKRNNAKNKHPLDWLAYNFSDDAQYKFIRTRIIKAFTEAKMFSMEELVKERLFRLHKSSRFTMNLSFSYDYFKISIYDDNTQTENSIDYLNYKKFNNSNFTNMLYILGRFIKAMDNGVHPKIVLENMEIENTLNELT